MAVPLFRLNLKAALVPVLFCVLLSGCNREDVNVHQTGVDGVAGSDPIAAQAAQSKQYKRIVSLDYCADQFVLKFVPRNRIAAVSPDATKEFSYMRQQAHGLPSVQARAEDVILLEPDLIVRSYGGGANSGDYFKQLGIPVLDVGWAGDIDGVLDNVERMASSLGATQQGLETVADVRKRLSNLSGLNQNTEALYMTPSGATTGAGSLVHELFETAGLRNFQTEAGWRSLPLERLAYEQPAVVAAAFFQMQNRHPGEWSASRHPVARALFSNTDTEVVHLQGAWMTCGGWYLIEAVEALAARQKS